MVTEAKKQKVAELSEVLTKARSVVLADFTGIGVLDISELRQQLKAHNSELKVMKNRLIKRALTGVELENMDDLLVGPTALALGYEDAEIPAKILTAFAKGHQHLKIKGGLLEKKRIDTTLIAQLAALPSKNDLIVRMLGSLNTSSIRLAQVLNASVSKLVYALKAVADAKT